MTNATNKTPAQLRAEVIAEFEGYLSEKRRAMDGLRNVLLGQGWIVVSADGLALTFDTETVGRETKLSNVRVAGGAHKALRMTESDAKRIAATCTNGRGETAIARHVRDALQDEIDSLVKTIEQLKAIQYL
jgi:hypothetical protein